MSLLASCSPEEKDAQMPSTDDFYLSFSSNRLGKDIWNEDDRVKLMSAGEECIMAPSEAGRKVNFKAGSKASLKAPFVVVYPAELNSSFDGIRAKIDIPSEQTPAQMTQAVFAGKSSNRTISLSPVSSRLSINLVGSGKYKSISISGLSGEKISGTCAVSFQSTIVSVSAGTSDTVTYSSDILAEGLYYFCVVPVTFLKGVRITLGLKDGGVETLTYNGKFKLDPGASFHLGNTDDAALQGVEQPEVIPTEGKTLSFDFSTGCPSGWPTAKGSYGVYSFSQGGESYDFIFSNTMYYSSWKCLLVYGDANSCGLPAFKNYKLTKVSILTPVGRNTAGQYCTITADQAGSKVISGGERKELKDNTEYSWTLNGTEENQVCYLYSTREGAPVLRMTLTYEPCAARISRMNEYNHPRLIMNDAALVEFKSALDAAASDSPFRQLHELAMKIADETVSGDDIVRSFDSSGRMLGTSRQALKRIFNCAYAYRVTEDPKYLARAEKDLLTVSAYDDWNGKKHFLDVGEMCAAVAIGYDWLYADLQETTRAAIEKAYYSYGIGNVYRRQWNLDFLNTTGNWEQVCCGGLCAAALAMYEAYPSDAQFIIDKCKSSNLEIAPRLYSNQGNYPEGYSYWEYGSSFQSLMNLCLETAAGDNSLSNPKGFDQTPNYYLFLEGPSGMCFNYSDTSPNTNQPALTLWYFAAKYDKPSLIVNEIPKIAKNYGSGEVPRLLPIAVWAASKLDFSKTNAAQDKMYVGNGENPVIVMRNGWGGAATDYYVGFKGGKANNSHGHMDAGSFIMDYHNLRWAYDFTRPSYATVEAALKAAGGDFWSLAQNSLRWQVNVMNNLNHNTLTINGAQHVVSGSATITDSFENVGEMGGTMDLTPVYAGNAASVKRTLKVIGKDVLYVIDEIEALPSKAAAVEWRMVSKAVPTVSNTNIKLTQGGYNMYLYTVSSPEVELTTYSNAKVKSWDSDITKYNLMGWKHTVPAGGKAVITTVIAPTAP